MGPGQSLQNYNPFSGDLVSWEAGAAPVAFLGKCLGRGLVKLKAIPGVGTPCPSSTETINDGQFHTVGGHDQMVNLSIDGGSP